MIEFQLIKVYKCLSCEKVLDESEEISEHICKELAFKITDEKIADIFYVLVHDFSKQIVFEAEGQRKHNEDRYIKIIELIRDWSKEKGFVTIRKHAENLLGEIETLKWRSK